MVVLKTVENIVDKKVRPVLQSHGGELEITGIENGIVYIKMLGACSNCPSASLSTKGFIEEVLMGEIPEIIGVEIDEATSPELLQFARDILAGKTSV